MKITHKRTIQALLSGLIILLSTGYTEAASDGGSSNFILYSLIVVGILFLFGIIIIVADNLLKVEAKRAGIERSETNYALLPALSEFFRPKLPNFLKGKDVIILKKGFNVSIEGEADLRLNDAANVTRYAIQPGNVQDMAPIPKLEVEIGDEVKVGDPILHDKTRPDIKFCAPVSGEVVAVNRGEKRSIAEVVILADKELRYREMNAIDIDSASREEIVNHLMASGVWPMIKQRPYNVMAHPNEVPDSIYVSTFDSAPLAPDLNFVIQDKAHYFQAGLNLLTKLTEGDVVLGLNGGGEHDPHAAFSQAEGVKKVYFKGKHPAGNVGVQIHHIAPMTNASIVWTLGVQEVISLGALIEDGIYFTERIVALTGSAMTDRHYVRTHIGANVGELCQGAGSFEETRLISGDVLSGEAKHSDEFLNLFDDQVTAIPEGNYYELFGWLVPHKVRPSVSKTYPGFLFPGAKFDADTNTHGEQRAFVVTGQYEKLLPMDLYPQHLMKAILINDFERMEGLGIRELVEEDVALCEFACTSKMPLQRILREGLDYMREQG